MKRRWDLCRGNLAFTLAYPQEAVTAGARIPLALTVQNQGSEPVWIPADFGAYFELRYRFLDPDHPLRRRTDLDGVANDPFYARELAPGTSATQSVEFLVPNEPLARIEVFAWGNQQSGSLVLTVKTEEPVPLSAKRSR